MKKTISSALLIMMLATLFTGCATTDKRIYGEWVDDYSESGYGFGVGLQGYMSWQGMSLPIIYTLKDDLIWMAFMNNDEVEELAGGGDKEAAIRRYLQGLDDKIEYGLTFFGDHEFVLEDPPNSGNQQRYKRKSQTEQSGY